MMAKSVANPKPFVCHDCGKDFVSRDKLNHHQHKLHGHPRQLTVSISNPSLNNAQAAAEFNDETPTPSRFQDGELLQDIGKDTTMDTPARLLQEYQITPSVFDKDFRESFAKLAGKTSPALAGRDMVKRALLRQNSQDASIKEESMDLGSIGAVSPRTYLINHLNSVGPIVVSSGGALNPPVPTIVANPSMSLMQMGGLLLGQAMHGASNSDELQTQLQELWALSSQGLDSLLPHSGSPSERETSTPRSEGFTNGREGSVKRKADDMSDSMSVASSSERSATPARKTKAILPTDDPQLADKRRRNRLAAEKCREKRKARQRKLEEENEELQEKLKVLKGKYDELTQCTQKVIGNLQTENGLLRAENQQLQVALKGGVLPSMDGRAVSPAHGLPIILQSGDGGM
ncbi:transcription factor kayak-like [Paramacrobiotus metropolitanus]|uniref:transcription factor kayak-like n=1 Tax=Paramacrobiotus metropolitanus TaxID=2943436 RepID=UPI0024457FAD|nr:transcription factor kayak-like [Paramacrobiotus metropolitanus]